MKSSCIVLNVNSHSKPTVINFSPKDRHLVHESSFLSKLGAIAIQLMTSPFTSLLTSSHLDIKVPLIPISLSAGISKILGANSRRTLFFGITLSQLTTDESVSLFVVFNLPIQNADATQLDAFLKETVLTLEVAITDTPRQSDPGVRREKFEGTVVYTATVQPDAERITEQDDGQWLVAWTLTVPISTIP
jgi:hypothetical protein